MKNILIGEVLKEYGYITQEQLDIALSLQKENREKRIGQILLENGFILERQLLEALAQKMNLLLVNLAEYPVDIDSVERIPLRLAQKYRMLAISCTDGILTVVVNDPLDLYAIEDVKQLTGCELKLYLSELVPLLSAIDYYYAEVSARLATREANKAFGSSAQEYVMEDGESDAPIIKLLNSLILHGYSRNASDIHVEPFEEKTLVRMRVDGVLVEFITLQKSVHLALLARIKIVANLNIAEKRLPQDGHFRSRIEGEYVNIRVSVIPTVFGEKAVLRLLSNSARIDNASHFGMSIENSRKFSRMMAAPHGIIYLTGPTGSGKTTTLYMALETMAKENVNISTIEDPVEKNIAGVNQMQVNTTAGLTFESGLRALLRQDPDVIMVGETRDAETASISVRAAITGHLVFSTLHTNSAAASIVRLGDMGLAPYMIASALVGIIAQRLVRKVCVHCSKMEAPTDEERLALGRREVVHVPHIYGCEQCGNTGYRGRTSVHEILLIDQEIRRMIVAGASEVEIEAYAVKAQQMKTLRDSAAILVEQGITTIEEMNKITYSI